MSIIHGTPLPQVTEGDGLPSQVCLQCVHYIGRAFSFKQLCERSDSTLRQLLGLSTATSDAPYPELKSISANEFVVIDPQTQVTDEIANLMEAGKKEEGERSKEDEGMFR